MKLTWWAVGPFSTVAAEQKSKAVAESELGEWSSMG